MDKNYHYIYIIKNGYPTYSRTLKNETFAQKIIRKLRKKNFKAFYSQKVLRDVCY